jgi:S-adenosylmethionine hydrolase
MALLTLLTDFGLRDYYVAAVKGTVLRLARGTTVEIVDLGHEVEPGDVAGAAFLLAAAAPTFPRGAVHLAVVDPGVGGERRILALAAAGALFVAPDNGLLTPFLDAGAAHAVERPDLYLPGPGETFHGRDRFAPVAAALLSGEPIGALGPPVADARRLEVPRPRRSGQRLEGEVVHVDRFGNLVTNLPSAWLPPRFRAAVEGRTVELLAGHYELLPPGVPGLVPGSLGTLEVSLRGASLAERWGVGRGAAVRIASAED